MKKFMILGLFFSLILTSLSEAINVKDYGARGDGINDDIKSFELAINNLKDWETLYIPDGTYRISKSLIIKNKHRIKIRNDGVIKPHRSFSGDYLIKIVNDMPDDIIPSIGMNVIIDNLTIDCEWKAKGILFDGIYDFSIKDLHIWRPYGNGIKIIRAQEGSFWKPVIFAGKKRINKSLHIEDWDSQKKYGQGEVVKINFPVYKKERKYRKGEIVNYENVLYRSLKDFNQNMIPSNNPDYWEWLPFEFFKSTSLPDNINKNAMLSFTTRNNEPTKKYWEPFYLDEAALEIITEQEHATVDNIKFFNLIIRSCENNPLIRIDNIKNSLKPLKSEFYASQIHVITEPYITSFNRDENLVSQYGQFIKLPEKLILFHIPNSYGLKIIGGNIQLGTIKEAKAFQFGTLGKKNDPGSGNTAMTFLDSFSIEGNGLGQVGISILPSVKTFSKWHQNGVFIILKGDKSFEIIDLEKELF